MYNETAVSIPFGLADDTQVAQEAVVYHNSIAWPAGLPPKVWAVVAGEESVYDLALRCQSRRIPVQFLEDDGEILFAVPDEMGGIVPGLAMAIGVALSDNFLRADVAGGQVGFAVKHGAGRTRAGLRYAMAIAFIVGICGTTIALILFALGGGL